MIRNLINILVALVSGLSVFSFGINGKLAFFVNPIYDKMIVMSGLVLCIFAFIALFVSRKSDSHYHYSNTENTLFCTMLIVFIGFTNLIEPKPLSASTAKSRGLNQEVKGVFDSANFGKPSEQRNLIDWITQINYNPEPSNYVGQKASVEGFIIIDSELPNDYFYVAKTVIRCCIADAVTGVLPVKYNKTNFSLKENDWVKISGNIIESNIKGKRQIAINATKIEKIKTPKNPYDY